MRERLLRALYWLWRQVFACGLVLLVLAAVCVGLGRQLVPLVSHYKPELEAMLSREAGMPVRIRELRGEWQRFSPRFVAEDIELLNPHDPAQVLLRLPLMETRPAMVASLWNREPRLITTLRGLTINLVQDADGRIHIEEMASLSASDPEVVRQAVNFLLRQPALMLEAGSIGLDLYGRPHLLLRDIDFRSLNDAEQHFLSGSFRLGSSGEPVSLILDYRGNPADWQQGQLQGFVSLPELDAGTWLRDVAIADWHVVQMHAGGHYWFAFQQGNLQSLTADLRLRDVEIAGLRRQQGIPGRFQAHDISGVLQWQREADGWQFSADRLQGQFNGLPLPAPRFALRRQGERIDLTAAQLALAPVRALMPQLSGLPKPLLAWLSASGLSGWLPHLHVQARIGEDGTLEAPAVQAQFKAIQFQATRDLPGAANLAGWLRVAGDGGLLFLDSRDAVLDLHTEFREPLQASQLLGGLRLRRAGDYWALESGPLHVRNADAEGEARLAFYRSDRNPGAATLHLSAGLRNGNAASAWRYVPWPVAGDHTLDWLRQAITAGRVRQGDFLYDGPVHDGKGLPPHVFQMRFQVDGATLAYDPAWPPLEDLSADVGIDNLRLFVVSPGARVYNSQARSVMAEIPDLLKPVLSVKGKLNAHGEDVMRLFRESALKEDVGRVADVLDVEGMVGGELGLRIPLAGSGLPRVHVSASLPGNVLRLREQNLVISQLQGNLEYSTEKGLNSSNLAGMLLDEPVQARIVSNLRGRSVQSVHVSLDGSVTSGALHGWLESPLLRYLNGRTDYQAEVFILGGPGKSTQVEISSGLAGMQVNLPAPLGKGVEPLAFRYLSDVGDSESYARLLYGRRANAGLVWRKGELERGLVRIGIDTVAAPREPGLQLEARLPGVNLADWQDWWKEGEPKGGVEELPAFSRLSLETRELTAMGLVFADVRASARRDGDDWDLRFGSDRLDGRVRLPAAKGRLQATDVVIDRLLWPLRQLEADKPVIEPGPAGLPGLPMNVQVRALRFDRWPALPDTQLAVRLLPSPSGIRAESLTASNPAMSFSGSADWQWRGGDETRLSGSLQSPDIARVLAGFGYSPTLNSKQAKGSLDVGWSGSPADFSLDRLDGSVKLELADGRLLNIGAVTSASRVFGLLDLDNLKRRLRLDFSDVTRKGVAYDSAQFEAQLRHGVLSPSRFGFKGPSMAIEGQGRIDLNSNQLDQELKVTIPMSSAVPVAAAVVGGPLVGGAVVAAERVLDKPLGKLSALHYHITGDWNDPQVERRSGWGK